MNSFADDNNENGRKMNCFADDSNENGRKMNCLTDKEISRYTKTMK